MSTWSRGYVSDIEYIGGFYRDQSPSIIDFVCLLNGCEPPTAVPGYTYCELGCGLGLTATVLAAANPAAQYYAVDFNPAHIARARELAQSAEIDNVTFLEAGFDELLAPAAPPLPLFDYVTLHGVYTWVGPEIRRSIVAFLRRFVKPGGAVYVSYNALPAWSIGLAVQRLLYEHAERGEGGGGRRIERAVAFAEQLRAAKSGPLSDNPVLDEISKTLRSGDRKYLAHEYLNLGWAPIFFADLAREFEAAKLDFVGSAEIFDNFLDFTMTEEQRALLTDVDDPVLRETVKDLCRPRRLRKDIFVRGVRRMTNLEREHRLRGMAVAAVVPRSSMTCTVRVPIAEAQIPPEVYEPIFDVLAEGPATIGALVDGEAVKGHDDAKPVEVAGMVIGSGHAMPLAGDGTADPAPARRLNRLLGERTRLFDSESQEAFAAPALGSGLRNSAVDRLAVAALAAGAEATVEALLPHVLGPIRARGEHMIKEGKAAESEAENEAIASEMIAAFLDTSLPLLKRLGGL
ncbi:MAG: methyltransferase domain-containing protein [Inquilinus sp.]|nr:methyltransferase domain-containing protein [Inquilinus sp.]